MLFGSMHDAVAARGCQVAASRRGAAPGLARSLRVAANRSLRSLPPPSRVRRWATGTQRGHGPPSAPPAWDFAPCPALFWHVTSAERFVLRQPRAGPSWKRIIFLYTLRAITSKFQVHIDRWCLRSRGRSRTTGATQGDVRTIVWSNDLGLFLLC